MITNTAADWKAAQVWFKESPQYAEMLKKHLKNGVSCDDDAIDELAKVSLSSQAGVFIIAGGICATGLAVAAAELVMSRRQLQTEVQASADADIERHTSTTHISTRHSMQHWSEGDMLRDIMLKIGVEHAKTSGHMTEGEMLREIMQKLDRTKPTQRAEAMAENCSVGEPLYELPSRLPPPPLQQL